jgi:hypothetical protein
MVYSSILELCLSVPQCKVSAVYTAVTNTQKGNVYTNYKLICINHINLQNWKHEVTNLKMNKLLHLYGVQMSP